MNHQSNANYRKLRIPIKTQFNPTRHDLLRKNGRGRKSLNSERAFRSVGSPKFQVRNSTSCQCQVTHPKQFPAKRINITYSKSHARMSHLSPLTSLTSLTSFICKTKYSVQQSIHEIGN
ncbi:06ad325d-3167-44a3-815f-e2ca8520eb1a [Sclerotinia trifoliorum]|uniref:06ad325d-3167-44a3-815f-e2ca8520eb1a n=1 Tax=Sclerotinia trifoliorum TaxID=28548 RepID=A0A8H2ZRA4_9HELO|nr:06ad325d-3167-44a3-815f-e2ca8520eb1a [Sclerotinia trifoliorum]